VNVPAAAAALTSSLIIETLSFTSGEHAQCQRRCEQNSLGCN
jgi:hypothetical protein